MDYRAMDRDALLSCLAAVREALAAYPDAAGDELSDGSSDGYGRDTGGALRALEQAHGRCAHLFDFAPVAYFSLDADGVIRDPNRAAVELLGGAAGKVVGRRLAEWLPQDQVEQLEPHLSQRPGAGVGVVSELTLRGPQGTPRVVRLETRASRVDGATLVLCTLIDITEQRRAQAEVARLNDDARHRVEALEALFALVPVGIAVMEDPEGTRVRANATAMQLLGVDAHGRGGYAATQDGEALSSPLAPLREVATSGRIMEHVEIDIAAPEGPRTVLTDARPLFDAQGAPAGAVATYSDITERHAAEHALRESERSLRERSEQLHEADRRKNEFLAVLGHELRNPLAPLRNSVQMCLLRSPDDPKLARPLAIMDRQITHLTRLVDDLLDVSRISSGQITLIKEPVRLAHVMQRAEELALPLMSERGHQLEVVSPPEDCTIDGDATRLVQALGNLLNNAARYTPQGGHVRMEGDVHEGMARVRVSDDGAGLDARAAETIFDPFVQLEGDLGSTGGGLGVGLTLVRSIVQLHAGQVDVYSEGPGKGSVFSIHLPLAPAREPSESPAPVTPGAIPPQRVLVVDDQAVVAESFAELLRSLGHEVEVAHGGEAALRVAAAFRPKVAFVDIGMPGMHGCELARRLRAAYGDAMALVALSGYGGELVKDLPGHEAFDRHLLKPAPLDEVLRVLEQVAAEAKRAPDV
ncbi:PAS domain-containing protein [Ectothiorhodospiraceae bacterium 2226]|nr:PAS domain-containing protein [Ectothiorhodospiraceae bacterium 2226]